MTLALEFSRVSVSRNLVTVLRDITFSLKDGESAALLGPNGSGKSTLIKLVTRELYPSDGKIRVFGKESWDVFALRSLFGIVSNDLQTVFHRDMTGLDAVLSGFFTSVGLWKNNVVTAAMRKKSAEVLKKLGISHLAKRPMDHISSGEARRLLIARALVHSPRALVFDEPSNSLDLAAQHTLRKDLSRLARLGHGMVLATHQLSDIVPEIKRVILLKGGKIVEDGRKEKLLTPEKLKTVFGAPVRIAHEDGLYHSY